MLVPAAAAMGWYHWRVTGSPWRMPYHEYLRTYAIAPLFLWQSPRPGLTYRHPEMERYHRDWEYRLFRDARTWPGWQRATIDKLRNQGLFFLGPALAAPLLLSPWMLRDRRVRLLLLAWAATTAGLLWEVFPFPHYAAPITGPLLALTLQSMRHCYVRARRRVGRFFVRSIPAICLAALLVALGASALGRPPRSTLAGCWFSPLPQWSRAPVMARLRAMPGLHLVLVRYAPEHDPHVEWVYNQASIDVARIVWAHELDPAANRALLSYFHNRRAWLLEPDVTPPSLSPYPLP